MEFKYKSFCWCLGTTSFRTKNFNKTIEEQLKLIREFWNIPFNKGVSRKGNEKVQIDYYNFLHQRGFLSGTETNKAKTAREKTSGLVDIGLIEENRHISNVGKALLDLCDKNDFSSKNILNIDEDSFIYLKQLLKVSNKVGDDFAKPFIIVLRLLSIFEYLSFEEFTYLVPLCINEQTFNFIEQEINNLRNGITSINGILINFLFQRENYKQALNYFVDNEISKELIMDVGMNRKSRKYDEPYYNFYLSLKQVLFDGCSDQTNILRKNLQSLKLKNLWKQFLFYKKGKETILKDFSDIIWKNEEDFKIWFFEHMHLFKLKATLNDYFDLNKRYLKTSDILIFEDNKIKIDLIPKAFFSLCLENVVKTCFTESKFLFDNIDLEVLVNDGLKFDDDDIIAKISEITGEKIANLSQAKTINEKIRYKRFINLIDKKFNTETIIKLLDLFQERADDEIQKIVTDNADIPTIFEYIIGIAWFNISERKVNILKAFNLSLDSDLLPKTHAGGGEADIIFRYEEDNKHHPKHDVLIEVTLSDFSSQRRMEMEPVSRHLGEYLLKFNNDKDYSLFITNKLHINVLSDFKSRKFVPYFDLKDNTKYVSGMKIIPLQTMELKVILEKDIKYKTLYMLFEATFNVEESDPIKRYDKNIKCKLLEY